MEKEFLTVEDLAKITRFSKNTIYKLTSKKKITHFKPNGKIVLFRREDVEEFLTRNRVEACDTKNLN
ncbi:MAG: helix-turn-helix domain-containing protein [Porphyromonadaceae bacterium]|nr:helix-turn-helix domain-containing protein [Porphyromonadaceae bacterium]